MALDPGSVSIDSGGVVTGTGYALVLYNARIAAVPLPDPNAPPPGFSAADCEAANLATKTSIVNRCNVDVGVLTYIAANGVARVKSDATGDNVQAGTTHPIVDKDIPIF
jgi:hypothetical protein